MRRTVVALAVGVVCFVCSVAAEEKKVADVKLTGVWKVTAYARGGKPVETDKIETVITFEDGKYKAEGRNFPGKSGKFKVDATKSPVEITLTPDDGPAKGKDLEGILELDGDKVKMCVTGAGGKRPAKFEGTDAATMLIEAKKKEGK